MRRCIELVSMVILVVTLASVLGIYTGGIGVPLGLSQVAAQDDHGGDDHDDGGDGFDDGHDDGGGDGHTDIGDGADHTVGNHDDGPLGDLDRAGAEVNPGCFDCGRYIDPDCPGCGGYIDGDPTFVPGPKVFDNAVGLWYVIPAAGTDYDPLAVVVHDSEHETDFFDHDGDNDFDQVETRFLDPGRNRLLDSDSVQFFDPVTGELINPDSAEASGSGFNYEFRSDDALSAYERALGIPPEDFDGLPDLAAELAQKLDFRGFQDLGSDTVFTIIEAMGREAFANSDGGAIAGIFNALDTFAFEQLGGEQVFEAVDQMQGEDFQGMSGEQTSLVFDTMGVDQVVDLDAPVIAGIVGLFDPEKFQELGGEQVVQIVGALGEGELEDLGDQQALSITETLDVEQIGTVESGQISGLIKAIDANDIGNLGESKLEAIVEGLETDDLSVLEQEKASEIFEGVGDSVILTLPDDSKDAALDALDANFFDRGTRFNFDLPKDTIIEQLELETPPVLEDLLKDLAFFRSTNLLGCASAGNCRGVIDRVRPVATLFSLTATSSAGGSVDPSGTTDHNAGDFVTVTATPHDGYVFAGWSGACGGDGGCTLSMEIDKAVRAEFIPIFTFTVPELPIGYLGVRYRDFSFCQPTPGTGLFCGGPLPINPEPTNPSGGTPHYTFSHGTGLPLGLTLNFNGVLTGTVAENSPRGTRRFDVCAHDQGGIDVCQQTEIFIDTIKPLEFSTFILPDAIVGETYQGINFASAVTGGIPFSNGSRYIFGHHPDFAAPPGGLTVLEDGTWAGKPEYQTATNFEICVSDFTGQSTCQFFEIRVNPAPDLLSGTWSGGYSASTIGDGGCTYNSSGALSMTISQDGRSVSGSATTDGLERRFINGCTYAYDSTGSGSVTGSITGDTVTLNFNFNTDLGPMTFEGVGTLENNTITGSYLRTGRTALDGAFTLTLQ